MSKKSKTIRISKSVPMPVRTSVPDLPLDQMVPGDSFKVGIDSPRDYVTIRQRLYRYQTAHPPVKFSMQKIDTDNVRVFRIEDHE